MNTYAWSCLACEETNAAGSAACSRCACPAQASRARIEAARDAYRQYSGLPPIEAPDVVAAVRRLPLLLIGAAVLLLLGGFALIVGSNVSVTAFGGLLIALAAFCASSYRKAAPP